MGYTARISNVKSRKMKLPLLFIVILFLTSNALAKKKKKAKKEKPVVPADDSKMFDSKTLKCLVCQNVVKEFEAAIFKVVPFARSQIHLLELTEKICEQFEEYAQAKWKSNGQPTIIRITNPDGNMNPEFGKVDIVPDEDLSTKLKFHCEGIVEDMDEHFPELLADEANSPTLAQRICVEEGEYCKSVKEEL